MKIPRRSVAAALIFILAQPSFASIFSMIVLRQIKLTQSLSEYEGQLPEFKARIKQNIDAGGVEKKPLTKVVVLAPIVHTYSMKSIDEKGKVRVLSKYWRFNEKGSHVFEPGMDYHALQRIQDQTYEYVAQGLRERHLIFVTLSDVANAKIASVASAMKPASTIETTPENRAYGAYTYSSYDAKDWANVPLQDFSGSWDVEAGVYVRSSDLWVDQGDAKIDGEAVMFYDVHHRFEVKVCTGAKAKYCSTVTVPGKNGDLVSRLFIPSFKASDNGKRAEHGDFAVKMAARHNAEAILAAFDAAASYPADGSMAVEPAGQSMGDSLNAPASLKTGQHLLSKDGRFDLGMQTDGNLVLSWAKDRNPLWSSLTAGKGAVIATMQEDGNLVLYKADGAPVWASNTWKSGAARATMQDDGNFVLYKADGSPVWGTMTHGH